MIDAIRRRQGAAFLTLKLHGAGQIADQLRTRLAAQRLQGVGRAGAIAGRGAGLNEAFEPGKGARGMLQKEPDRTGEEFVARAVDLANAVEHRLIEKRGLLRRRADCMGCGRHPTFCRAAAFGCFDGPVCRLRWSLFMDHISHLLSLGHAAQRRDSEAPRFAALYEASHALNLLCRVELARQASPVAGRDTRGRLLGRLQEAIATAAGADEAAIDVDGVLAKAIANGDGAAVDVENWLEGSCITAAVPAFAALVFEIVAFGASMGRDGAPARVTLEGSGADVCLWVHFDPTKAAGGEDIAFMVEGIGVLALLNRGELFIDEAASHGALGFGVRLPGAREGHDTLRGPADFATAV